MSALAVLDGETDVPEMSRGERVRAHLLLGFLEIALREEYGNLLRVPHYPTLAAFSRARDELSMHLSVQAYECPHLLAGIAQNRAATLLYEDIGVGYTRWAHEGARGMVCALILAAVRRVRDDLAVTAM